MSEPMIKFINKSFFQINTEVEKVSGNLKEKLQIMTPSSKEKDDSLRNLFAEAPRSWSRVDSKNLHPKDQHTIKIPNISLIKDEVKKMYLNKGKQIDSNSLSPQSRTNFIRQQSLARKQSINRRIAAAKKRQ